MKKAGIWWLLLALVLWLTIATPAADAQSGGDYRITRGLIAGGGGEAGNTDYRVGVSVGQALAGTVSGGDYTLRGGYWQPLPGAPAGEAIYADGFETRQR